MFYKEGIDYLVRRFSKNISDAAIRLEMGAHLNFAYREVADSHFWEILRRTSSLTLIPFEKTGNVTITKGSRIVTFSTDSGIAANWVGRYFHIKGKDAWYLIVYIDTATRQATLHQEIVEDNQTSDFEVWKRFYYLVSEARLVLGMDDLSGVSGISPASNTADIFNPGQVEFDQFV